MSLNDNVCEINGVDLMDGLVGRKREIFADYLSGFSNKEIANKFPHLDVDSVINNQVEYLQTRRSSLLDYTKQEFSMTTSYFED